MHSLSDIHVDALTRMAQPLFNYPPFITSTAEEVKIVTITVTITTTLSIKTLESSGDSNDGPSRSSPSNSHRPAVKPC